MVDSQLLRSVESHAPDVGELSVGGDALNDAFDRAEGDGLVLVAFEVALAEGMQHAVRKSGRRRALQVGRGPEREAARSVSRWSRKLASRTQSSMSVCQRPLAVSCVSTRASTCSFRTLMRKLRRKSSSLAIGSDANVVGEGEVDESDRRVRNSGMKMVSHELPRAQRALAYWQGGADVSVRAWHANAHELDRRCGRPRGRSSHGRRDRSSCLAGTCARTIGQPAWRKSTSRRKSDLT
jgi:hypothetical protein